MSTGIIHRETLVINNKSVNFVCIKLKSHSGDYKYGCYQQINSIDKEKLDQEEELFEEGLEIMKNVDVDAIPEKYEGCRFTFSTNLVTTIISIKSNINEHFQRIIPNMKDINALRRLTCNANMEENIQNYQSGDYNITNEIIDGYVSNYVDEEKAVWMNIWTADHSKTPKKYRELLSSLIECIGIYSPHLIIAAALSDRVDVIEKFFDEYKIVMSDNTQQRRIGSELFSIYHDNLFTETLRTKLLEMNAIAPLNWCINNGLLKND